MRTTLILISCVFAELLSAQGNVGIGTSSPQNKLDVAGGAAFGSSYAGMFPVPSNGMIVEGKVGIGAPFPQNKLEVAGGASFGAGYVGGISAPVNGMIIQGNVGIGTPLTQNKLDVSGGASFGSGYAGAIAAPANGMIIQGNVGIGTLLPMSRLSVSGGATVGAGFAALSAPTNGMLIEGNIAIGIPMANAKLTLHAGASNIAQTITSGSTVGTWLGIGNISTGGKYFQFISTGSENGEGAGHLLIGYSSAPGLVDAVPMVIRGDNGYIGIGTINPGTLLHVNGSITATCGVLTCSDRRYKTRITSISNSLDRIKQLQGVYYYWDIDQHPDKAFSGERQIGVIAQDVEQQFPELVHTDESGYKTVDYAKLSAILLNAVNELHRNQKRIIEENALLKSQLQEVMQLREEVAAIKLQIGG